MPFLFKKKDTSELPIQAIATQNGGAPAIPTIDFGFSRFAPGQNSPSAEPSPAQRLVTQLPEGAAETPIVTPDADYLTGNSPQHPYEQAYVPLPEVEPEEASGHLPEYGYASARTRSSSAIESPGQAWDAVDWMSPSAPSLASPVDFEDPLPYTTFNDPLPLTPMEPALFPQDSFGGHGQDDFMPLSDDETLPNWGEALTDFQPLSASKNSESLGQHAGDPFSTSQRPEVNALGALYAASPWSAESSPDEFSLGQADLNSSSFISLNTIETLDEQVGTTCDSIPEPPPAAYPMPLSSDDPLTGDFGLEPQTVSSTPFSGTLLEPIVDITAPQKSVSDPFSTASPVLEKEEDFWSHAAPGFDDEDVQALGESLSPVSPASLLSGPGSPEYAGEMHDKVGLDYYPSDSQSVSLSPAIEEVSPNPRVQPVEEFEWTPEKQMPHPAPFETLSQSLSPENSVLEPVLEDVALAAGAIGGVALAGLGVAPEPEKVNIDQSESPSIVEVQPTPFPATELEALCDPSQLSIQEIVIVSPQRVLFLGRLNTSHSALFGLAGDRISLLHRFDHNLLSDIPSEPLVFNHSLEGAANGKEMYLVQINRWKAVISASEQGFTLHTLLSA